MKEREGGREKKSFGRYAVLEEGDCVVGETWRMMDFCSKLNESKSIHQRRKISFSARPSAHLFTLEENTSNLVRLLS